MSPVDIVAVCGMVGLPIAIFAYMGVRRRRKKTYSWLDAAECSAFALVLIRLAWMRMTR